MKVIAESAFNHNGNYENVILLADAAKYARADIFTVQLFNCENFCIPEYTKFKIYKDCEISHANWIKVFRYCEAIGLDLLPCVLDETSFNFAYEYGFRFFKIHATDITNINFLQLIASKSDVRIFLETQCATAYDIRKGLSYIGNQVECIVQGFSNYPTDFEDLNLGALNFIKEEFNKPVGLADHSLDTVGIPVMALAMGCAYLEKHITLTRANRQFDWQVSLSPDEFLALTSTIRQYRKALGTGVKHPVKNELPYREVMYKKVNGTDKILRRSDNGRPFLEHMFNGFDRSVIVSAVVARLKSQRLKKKVLLKVGDKTMIESLIDRVSQYDPNAYTVLATSTLPEDDELATKVSDQNLPVFRGHAISVIDRLLSLAESRAAGGIFRITGDNLFTDPNLMKIMASMFLEHDLDYVRVNNVPFGISCELFSTAYLWRLYLAMENPLQSEYLSWFVIQDNAARKGCIDFDHPSENLKMVNLSIDYQADYDRAMKIYTKVKSKSFEQIKLSEIINNIDLSDHESPDKVIKLPEGLTMSFGEYLNTLNTLNYIVRHKLTSDDIRNW
jgi:N,N'-diacetyllegionaminate synthase